MTVGKLSTVKIKMMITKKVVSKLKHYLFTPRWHFSRVQFNLVATFLIFAGIMAGSYLTVTEILLPHVFALNDTTKIWTFNSANAGDYTYDSNLVTVDDNGARSVTGVNKITNPAFASNNDSWSVAISEVPSGWVEVPANATYGTGNFLVMQYEAKYDCTGDDDGDTAATCSATADDGLGLDYRDISSFDKDNVVSTANGAPIVHITQEQAATACPTGYHLITNDEWMTIARNVEAQTANWADGVIGSTVASGGGLKRGNVGEATSVGYNGDDPEYGTGRDEKAKLVLSNGNEVWDLSGNVWDWTSGTINGVDKPVGNSSAWVEWDTVTDFNGTGDGNGNSDDYLPSNNIWNADHGVGRYYQGANTGGPFAFLRGAYWNGTSNAGVFAVRLGNTPTLQHYFLGFRCASDSVDISQSFSSISGREATGGNTVTIGSIANGKIYQSINVGNTSTYNYHLYSS